MSNLPLGNLAEPKRQKLFHVNKKHNRNLHGTLAYDIFYFNQNYPIKKDNPIFNFNFLNKIQLIFSGEYTKAMNKDWHSDHFCCWQCDGQLTGQRYILRDDHP